MVTPTPFNQNARRPSPPRPTLLVGEVGDVEAISNAWDKLKVKGRQALEEGLESVDQARALVPPFRFLRESLMASGVVDSLAVQVYQMSVDVCCKAEDMSELLKSLQVLVHELHPRAINQQASHMQQQVSHTAALLQNSHISAASVAATTAAMSATQATAGAAAPGTETYVTNEGATTNLQGVGNEWADGEYPRAANTYADRPESQSNISRGSYSSSGSTASSNLSSFPRQDTKSSSHSQHDNLSQTSRCMKKGMLRHAEMVAAQVLLFGCVMHGRGPTSDVLQLLSSPAAARHLESAEVLFAVQVVKALTTGNFYEFLRAEQKAPTALLAALVHIRTPQMHEVSIRALASAFRTLPVSAAISYLNLQSTPTSFTTFPSASPHLQKQEQHALNHSAVISTRPVLECWDDSSAEQVGDPSVPCGSSDMNDTCAALKVPPTQSGTHTAAASAAATSAAAAAEQVLEWGKAEAAELKQRLIAQQKLLDVLRAAASHGCKGADTAVSAWLAYTAVNCDIATELVLKA